jgi:hypothetical protein
MIRFHAARCYLLAGMLVACVSSEPLAEENGQRDATQGVGGRSTTTGQGGRSGSGGGGASGGESGSGGSGGSGGISGNGGAGGADLDASGGRGGGTGGSDFDASGGRGGSSGSAARDASRDEATTRDAPAVDHVSDTGGIDAGDAEGGTCGPMFCFDVFECWFLFPQCGYTACELFACKK